MDRRDLFKLAGTSALFYFSGCSNLKKNSSVPRVDHLSADELLHLSPLNRLRDQEKVQGFTGDDPHFSHHILWDKDAFITAKGGLPLEYEKASVVIVGGGVSGLISALELSHLNPVVLEQANRFGGNSKGESFEGLDYAIGAAYFTRPYPGTRLDQFLERIGAYSVMKVKTGEDPVVLKNKIFREFWSGETVKKSEKAKVKKLADYFENMFHGEKGLIFPDIPVENLALRDYINTLDSRSFHEHIKSLLDGEIPSHVETALEQYCWSAFGGSAKEISAATALNFYVGELGEVLVPAGGNSAVAEKIFFELASLVPKSCLRTKSLVFDVNHKSDGVEVSYVDPDDNVKVIKADYVIMACPKFVVAKILNNIEDERLNLIARLKYRSYMVANILLTKKCKEHFYDLYMLGEGKVPKVKEDKTTDVTLANFADQDENHCVLTLYHPIPRDHVREEILKDEAFTHFEKKFKQDFQQLKDLLGFSDADVKEYRLTRWGHPIPLSEKGLIAQGVTDKLIAPFGDRIYFADQDNWMLPCFEACAFEAFRVADIIKGKLKPS